MSAPVAIFLGLLALGGLVFVVGSRLPREHTASTTRTIESPLEKVWALLVDHRGFPAWRAGLTSVDEVADPNGRRAWVERGKWGAIPYLAEAEVLEADRGRLVTRITDAALPYGGTWTWELERAGAATRVTITEQGFVDPPLFRLLTRYVFGYTRTQVAVLEALSRRCAAR